MALIRTNSTHRKRLQEYMTALEEEVRRLREYEILRPQLLRQIHALRRVQFGDSPPVPPDSNGTVSSIGEGTIGSGCADCGKRDSTGSTNNFTQSIFNERQLNHILRDPQVGIDFVLMQVATWNPPEFTPGH